MSTISAANEFIVLPLAGSGTNGQAAPADNEQSMHQFQPGLGDHPLWPALMDEMEKNRQADIAEANRLADLELFDLAQLKLPF